MPLYRNQEPLAEPMPTDAIERAASELEQHIINRKRLKEQLLEEVEAAKLKEKEGPKRVPSPADHCSIEHPHPQRLARVSGVMNFRQEIQFEDDDLEKPEQTFFGIPRLKRQPPRTISKPYEEKSFSQNTIRTR